jgi:hypothetical protein
LRTSWLFLRAFMEDAIHESSTLDFGAAANCSLQRRLALLGTAAEPRRWPDNAGMSPGSIGSGFVC